MFRQRTPFGGRLIHILPQGQRVALCGIDPKRGWHDGLAQDAVRCKKCVTLAAGLVSPSKANTALQGAPAQLEGVATYLAHLGFAVDADLLRHIAGWLRKQPSPCCGHDGACPPEDAP